MEAASDSNSDTDEDESGGEDGNGKERLKVERKVMVVATAMKMISREKRSTGKKTTTIVSKTVDAMCSCNCLYL